MLERLNKVRKENPRFNEELVNHFAKVMPDLLNVMLDGYIYQNHIGSREVAELAEKFIVNDKDEHIGFHFDYDTVLNIAKKYVDLNETDYYPNDIFVFSNIQYGDMAEILDEIGIEKDKQELFIIRYSLSALDDKDFPYFPSSCRAYYWLKKNVENQGQQIQ